MQIINSITRYLTGWKQFDPQWLVELANEQHQDKEWLAKSLSAITHAQPVGSTRVFFVSRKNLNKPGAPWQYDHKLELHDPNKYGEIEVYVLKDKRVGGLRFFA
ncbi:MAG: hypothetical protein V4857_26155 [Pseudomonadota bacterium]